MSRAGVRLLVGAAIGLATVGAWSAQVSAHVTIDTLGPVTQGSFAKFGFSVPNERPDAGTVELSVQFPQDQPLAFVSVEPMAGWDITTTMRTLDAPLEGEGESISEVVDTITWTATGDTQIGPGQFELFWVSAGQMPTDVTELIFPAVQTYSSGEEVRWIEETPEGGAEPERPAPILGLVPAEQADTDAAPPTDDDSDTLSIVALVLGGLGLVVAVAAVVLARRSQPPRPA